MMPVSMLTIIMTVSMLPIILAPADLSPGTAPGHSGDTLVTRAS